MKTFLVLYLLFLCALCISCVYDPPKDGRFISIANQTDHGIYVFVDSIPENGSKIKWIDTSNANGRRYYANQIRFANAFAVNELFIPELYFSLKKKKGEDHITLFFMADSVISRDLNMIYKNNLIRSERIAIENIRVPAIDTNSLNVIFYYKDSIKFEHELHYQMKER